MGKNMGIMAIAAVSWLGLMRLGMVSIGMVTMNGYMVNADGSVRGADSESPSYNPEDQAQLDTSVGRGMDGGDEEVAQTGSRAGTAHDSPRSRAVSGSRRGSRSEGASAAASQSPMLVSSRRGGSASRPGSSSTARNKKKRKIIIITSIVAVLVFAVLIGSIVGYKEYQKRKEKKLAEKKNDDEKKDTKDDKKDDKNKKDTEKSESEDVQTSKATVTSADDVPNPLSKEETEEPKEVSAQPQTILTDDEILAKLTGETPKPAAKELVPVPTFEKQAPPTPSQDFDEQGQQVEWKKGENDVMQKTVLKTKEEVAADDELKGQLATWTASKAASDEYIKEKDEFDVELQKVTDANAKITDENTQAQLTWQTAFDASLATAKAARDALKAATPAAPVQPVQPVVTVAPAQAAAVSQPSTS